MFRPARFVAFLATTAVALVSLTTVSMSPAQAAADKNCDDFGSQKAAQIFFLKAGGPRNDPHGLDGNDNDGRACESNPAPYYYGKKLPNSGGGNGGGDKPKPKPKTVKEKAVVTKVIDGDTVRVKILPGGFRRDVRLIGIDTPEVYGGQECYGPQASKNLKSMLRNGTRVTLTSDPTQDRKDRYDRLLRYATKNVGQLNVNRRQIFNGSARVYVYNNKPFKQVRAFRQAQSDAQRADRGLWGKCR